MFKKSRKVLVKMLIVCYMATQLFFVVNIASIAQAPVHKPKHGKKKLSKKERKSRLKGDLRFFVKKVKSLKRNRKIAERSAKHHGLMVSKVKRGVDKRLHIEAKKKVLTESRKYHRQLKITLRKLKAIKKALHIRSYKKTMVGKASWYGGGNRNRALTAAMRGYRGKRVKVVNQNNGKSVTIVVNDYGPAKWTGRVIDLSRAAFSRVGATSQGVIPRVKLYVY